VERGNLDAGVLNLTLEWKPLPHLTAEMVEWMFGNLHNTARSPFDNKIYPMYAPVALPASLLAHVFVHEQLPKLGGLRLGLAPANYEAHIIGQQACGCLTAWS
jgi:hypothetical protein